ncbi:FliH/SctL family protein [Luteimonas sp. RC10]|uniref:FliH/SctL family protein n=1 Tax=Luteimonas sp. RC10 TaxID=2587035 RepID=UPI00160F93EC|nr:FliH/SctL family protein [Luteimonas sp. RC10]MBB3342839.1 flagellar biosynthesis/type III secretory pathway protein FliH [Luteimonas sp. RC10]
MSTAASPQRHRPEGSAAVFERRQFQRGVTGPIVRAAEWRSLGELDALLERVNALYDEAGAEVQKAREQGYAEGFAEGLERAKQQMTEQLASLNERRARVLAEASGRIGDLACAIVQRLAPGFDAAAVVPTLVMQAVESAQAEQFLMIRVHPSARERVSEGLGAVRQAHPGVGLIELVDDESLDPLSCIVVSEAGEVRAGVSQQIEAIRAALAQASAHHVAAP